MMSKKKAHSTANPENSISQDEFVTLVESLCQNSVNGQTDIIFRMREVYAQYHAATKDKMFAYDTNVPAIPFAQVNTTDVEGKVELILKTNLAGRIGESLDMVRSLWNDGVFTAIYIIKPDKKDYYRTRTNDKPLIQAREMFHTPFELRGLIKTARFSVLGFPSLYLTKNLFTSWEETRRSNIETLYASRLQLQRPIALLDLRLHRSFSDMPIEHRETEARLYLRMIPLIIACSLKVKQDADAFKPEYILPQLILHAVIDEMIRRSQLNRSKSNGITYVDSALEMADEDMDALLVKYGGDKQQMLDDVLKWSKSQQGDTKESIAATTLAHLTMAKYMEVDSPSGKLRLADADWLHYECNKGIRKFAEHGLDGIIYSSTRFDHSYWEQKEEVNSDCIVLPVHSLQPKGFCEYLLNAFIITPPVGFNHEYLKKINNKGSEKRKYQHSYFGLIEQELQKQTLQKLSNFYGTPIQRKNEEVERIFDEQINTLGVLSGLYDAGNTSIASLLGVVLRNLLGKQGMQQSLWDLKFGKQTEFCDSAVERLNVPQNFTIKAQYDSNGRMTLPNSVITDAGKVYDGFLRKEIGANEEYNLYPLLDVRKGKEKWVAFENWYNQLIFAVEDITFTRKQAIEIVAESEGNVSSTIPDNYALFSKPTSLRVRINGEQIQFNQNPVFVAIRQITWEVLESLERIGSL